ncbi:MAG: zinc-binding dehydrogenase [Cytophagales bacterium]|nr:zinc-binding dehydrogenase [Cytophagales bacterium]
MLALTINGVHQPLQLKELPDPQPADGEAVVRLRAAALNHRDVWIQKGQYAGLRYPAVLGSDGAGVVSSVGNPQHADWLGREVIVNPGLGWGDNPHAQAASFTILGMPENGTFAEYVKVPVQNLYAKPPHLSWEQAAALPLAGLTGYRALFSRAGAQCGEKVLVTGVGGGVALLVLQFAVAAGATVYVTSGSDEKIQQAVAMGAAGGANYNHPDWPGQLKQQAGAFDVIVDSAAGDGFAQLVDVAAGGGRIVFYGGTRGAINNLVPGRVFWKQLTVLGSTMGSDAEFAAMMEFVNEKKLVPVVSRVFSLQEGNAALEFMKSSSQFGKIVLVIGG